MGPALLTTAEVAALVRMSEEWVRDHAAELGAIRAGGARAPLRFEPRGIEAWIERQRLGRPKAARAPRPARAAPAGVELLPRPRRDLLTARR